MILFRATSSGARWYTERDSYGDTGYCLLSGNYLLLCLKYDLVGEGYD